MHIILLNVEEKEYIKEGLISSDKKKLNKKTPLVPTPKQTQVNQVLEAGLFTKFSNTCKNML